MKRFYGWTVLSLLFVMYSANTIGTNTLPLFFPELRTTFGWTHEQVTAPASFYFLYIALISPGVGWLLSRYPARRLMLWGSLLGIGSLVLYSRMSSLWQLFGVYILFSVAITSAGMIPSMVILSNWFVRFRGIAVGLFLVGSSFGGIVFPRVASSLIGLYGWRGAALGLAGACLLFVLIPVLFLRDHPREVNQQPDGTGQAPERSGEQRSGRRPGERSGTATNLTGTTTFAPPWWEGVLTTGDITLLAALRSTRFYLLLFVTATFWFCGFGVLQHSGLYFADLGLSATQTANVLGLFFASSILGKLTFGYLSDRFDKLNIMALATLNLIAGLVCLRLLGPGETVLAWAFAVLYGFGYSGAFAMIQLVVAELYRGAQFGRIYGLVTTTDSLAGFLGVFLLGILRTSTGSYVVGLNLLLLAAGLAFVCALLLRRQGNAQPLNPLHPQP